MTETSPGQSRPVLAGGASTGLEARLRAELGMPFLPTVFMLLADHPSYLRAATEAFLARLPDARDEHGQGLRTAT